MIFSTTSGKKFDICRIDKEKADKLIGEIGRLSQSGLSEERDPSAVQAKFRRFEDSLPDETRLVSFLYLADAIERRRFVREEKQLATLASDAIVDIATRLPPRRHAFDVLMETHPSLLSPRKVAARLEQIERHAEAVPDPSRKLKGLENVISNSFELRAGGEGVVCSAAKQILDTVMDIGRADRAYYLSFVAAQVGGDLGDRARTWAAVAYEDLSKSEQKEVDFNLARRVRSNLGLRARNSSPAPQ